jgi:HK97 family phage prohead protease
VEVILQGAFRSYIERGDDIAFLREHSSEMALSRTPKTLKVTEDSAGLRFVASMPDTPLADETLELVRNETLRGMSFSFALGLDDDSWSMEQDSATGKTYALRKIRNFSRVLDASVVLWPAYASASVLARALEARSSIASRAVLSESLRLKLADDARRKRLEWVKRDIDKDADVDDNDPEADDDFNPAEDGFRCERCGSGNLRCADCGEPVPVQKTDADLDD